MANLHIDESAYRKRLASIASRRSHFYLNLSNRLIMPLLGLGLPLLVTITPLVFSAGVIMILLEIVIRYIVKSTLKDELVSLYRFCFSTKRKTIRN